MSRGLGVFQRKIMAVLNEEEQGHHRAWRAQEIAAWVLDNDEVVVEVSRTLEEKTRRALVALEATHGKVERVQAKNDRNDRVLLWRSLEAKMAWPEPHTFSERILPWITQEELWDRWEQEGAAIIAEADAEAEARTVAGIDTGTEEFQAWLAEDPLNAQMVEVLRQAEQQEQRIEQVQQRVRDLDT